MVALLLIIQQEQLKFIITIDGVLFAVAITIVTLSQLSVINWVTLEAMKALKSNIVLLMYKMCPCLYITVISTMTKFHLILSLPSS